VLRRYLDSVPAIQASDSSERLSVTADMFRKSCVKSVHKRTVDDVRIMSHACQVMSGC